METPNYTGPIDASKKLEIAATFLGKFYYFFPHNSNQGGFKPVLLKLECASFTWGQGSSLKCRF